MATRKDMIEEIEIPNGIETRIEGEFIYLKKANTELKRRLNPLIEVKVNGNKIILKSDKTTKRERKIFGTTKAHINNMIKGLEKPFVYKLQSASIHFPMTLEVNKALNELHIKNFLGEKKPRVVPLDNDVEIKVIKDIIELHSANIEKAGQMATKIEKATKVRNRDRRIFQDGIFIIEKPGRRYL